ncbi:MAG TPA: DUF4956 domain-containing protein [Sphingomicrobium sp.]|nr:DUF4956 domain-containing protein [Sphingomicrobium sp.]
MLALRLFARLTAYYAVVTVVVLVVLQLFPALRAYMPFGGVEALMARPGSGLEGMLAPNAEIGNLKESVYWLVITIVGALLTAWPVSWVYIAVRNRKDYDQSLVDTIVILPIVVTSIIIIVQNSLALAFSIAGIAAAVRFRNSLKSSGDALFILLAVGIGLSAGIGALELAIVMTVAFNYVFLLLWVTDYGDRADLKKHYMTDCDPEDEPAAAAPADPT